MSGLESRRRGALLEGHAADLYVYDFDRLGYTRGRCDVVRDLPGGAARWWTKPSGFEWPG